MGTHGTDRQTATPPESDGGLGMPDPRSSDPQERRLARARLRSRLLGERDVPRPTIGRFRVIKRIGAGGMGTVYLAYDEVLDRQVALKVMRGDPSLERRLRVLREARAMAKLQHPNVAAVYEVGELEDELHIAMELIDGVSLRAWVADRAWPDVVDAYCQAGRGLAAAHAAGLIHRDFKPENVMVDPQGRARVLDFGLVHREESTPSEPVRTESSLASVAFDTPLTVTGAAVGTPAYMAPEQFRGGKTDAMSDQFSFCVALYEALYGERPFTGATLATLSAAVTAGSIDKPPRGTSVPGWLRAIVVRGLSPRKGDRWPSMEALVDALGRGRARARNVKLLAAVAVIAVTGMAVVGLRHVDRQRRIAACEDAGSSVHEVWNDDERAAVRASVLATGAGHAAGTADKLMPWLDEHAAAWAEARTQACIDADVRGRWSADLFDRSAWCLDERRLELAALVTRLKDADVETVTRGVAAAAGLQHVQPCRDATLLMRLPPPPTDSRDAIRAVRADLSRARAQQATGAYAEGLASATESLARARALAWPPLIAAAELRVGALLEKTGEYAEAEAMQESAYFDAAAAGALEDAFSAATALVYTVGYRQARSADGERWWKHAEVTRRALPDPGGLREATSLHGLGLVRQANGAYEEATELHARALGIREKALGPEHPEVATSLNNLASLHHVTGAYERAVALHERALAIRQEALGAGHPDVAISLSNLAKVHFLAGAYEQAASLCERAQTIREKALGPRHPAVAATLGTLANIRFATGDYDEAVRLHARALTIFESAVGPDHPEVATSLNNLAVVHQKTGAYEEAVRLHERALAIREKALDPAHPDLAQSLHNLAALRYATGSFEHAERLFARALAIREKALGPEHPEVAETLANLGNARQVNGAYEEAAALHERALAIWEKALGPDDPRLAQPLLGLAHIALDQKRAGDAVPLAERALALLEDREVPVVDVAEARFVLARALVEAGHSRERATALAEQARAGHRSLGDLHVDHVATIEAWLAKHRDRETRAPGRPGGRPDAR